MSLGLPQQTLADHLPKMPELAKSVNAKLARGLPPDKVGTLRSQGWSTRKIAEKLKVSVGTVHADSVSADVFNSEHVSPATITGKDGKQYPAQRREVEPPHPTLARREQGRPHC